jgi:SNF2 family DNA or RNA helicase
MCPTCRTPIQLDKLVAIVGDGDVNGDDGESSSRESSPNDDDPSMDGMGRWTKVQLLIRLIKRKPNGRFLVFSKLDASFCNIERELNLADIRWGPMKGHTSEMMNTLGMFKRGEIQVILLNTHYAGSGIDISCATDVVILHSMGLDKTQAVGRAQRVGRVDSLTVHNLCFAHEMGIGAGA